LCSKFGIQTYLNPKSFDAENIRFPASKPLTTIYCMSPKSIIEAQNDLLVLLSTTVPRKL